MVAVELYAAARASYGPVKLGLSRGPLGAMGLRRGSQGSIIASGTLRGSRRYRDDAQLHVDELGVLVAMFRT